MVEDFRGLLQELFRRFGLLSGDRTPCGKPLPLSDAHALMCLLDAGDRGLPQSTLVARLGIDKSTASRLVARLEDRGYVVTVTSDDGRARPVRLTRKGARVAREVAEASTQRFAVLLAGVPSRRRADVLAALRDIVGALDRLDLNPEPREERRA